MRILQGVKKYSVEILVILLTLVVQLAFVSQKEGYHMDELLSFELSNAEYNPWIVPTQPVGRLAKFMHEEIDGDSFFETLGNLKATVVDVLTNGTGSKLLSYKADVYEEPVWIKREQFHDYITTGEGDRFNYLSVYFNVKDDNHPPVHFMLLHTISSMFPGKVLPLMGCIINIAAVIGCVIIFLKLGTLWDQWRLTENKFGRIWGALAGVLYGCSQAAIATTLLIRMYGILTFLCLLLFYIHVRKWINGEFDKKNLWLILFTVLGFLTQYFFLFYCLVLAFVTAICLFACKRSKEFFLYIRSMIIAAVIGVGVFPFSISDVFSSSRGVEALDKLQSGFLEFLQRIGAYGEILLTRSFGNLWFGMVLIVTTLVFGVWSFLHYKGQRTVIVMLYLPTLGYFLLAAKFSPFYVDRYLMAVFPFVTACFAGFICFGAYKLGKAKNVVLTGIVVIFCGMHVFTYDGSYLYVGYEKQLEIAETYDNLPCICLYEGSGYYDNLLEFTEYEKTLLVTPDQLLERKNRADIEALEEVVFVVKNIIPEEDFLGVLGEYGLEVREVLIEDGACGDDVYLCGKAASQYRE